MGRTAVHAAARCGHEECFRLLWQLPNPHGPPAQLHLLRDLRGNLKPVDTAAALASGSTTRPPLSQPWARVLLLFLGSGPSPFEATRQPSKGRPETEDLRPDPLPGTACSATLGRWACACT